MSTNINLQDQTERLSALVLKAEQEGKSFFDVVKEDFTQQMKNGMDFYCNPWHSFNLREADKQGIWEGLKGSQPLKSIQDHVMEELQNKYKALCAANPGKKFKIEWSDQRLPAIENDNCRNSITVKIVEDDN